MGTRSGNFLREAIDDIRHKVVEEPWFQQPEGREITPDLARESVELSDNPLKALYGHRAEQEQAHATPDQTRGEREHTTDIER